MDHWAVSSPCLLILPPFPSFLIYFLPEMLRFDPWGLDLVPLRVLIMSLLHPYRLEVHPSEDETETWERGIEINPHTLFDGSVAAYKPTCMLRHARHVFELTTIKCNDMECGGGQSSCCDGNGGTKQGEIEEELDLSLIRQHQASLFYFSLLCKPPASCSVKPISKLLLEGPLNI